MQDHDPARRRSFLWRCLSGTWLGDVDRRLRALTAKNDALAQRVDELERTVIRLERQLDALVEVLPQEMRSNADDRVSATMPRRPTRH